MTALIEVSMTTLEIAELTKKAHKHVLDDCRGMFEDLGLSAAEFSATEVYYTGRNKAQRREREHYNLPKELVNTLVLKYSTLQRFLVVKELQAKSKALGIVLTSEEVSDTIKKDVLRTMLDIGRAEQKETHTDDVTIIARAFHNGTFTPGYDYETVYSNFYKLITKAVFGTTPHKIKGDTGFSPRDLVVESMDMPTFMKYNKILNQALVMIDLGAGYEAVKFKLLGE